MVTRLDLVGKLKKADSTPQGGLRAPAFLTRVGVFTYRNADGSSSRELRHPDDVFDEESLATLAGAPLTIGHPGAVDPQNWRQVTVGHVGDEVNRDGRFVAATVRVQDADAVAKVAAGELVELSCGYNADMEIRAGVYDGEPYDAIQRNIRYNHVGLGPKDWGRAGNEVALKLDNADVAYTNIDMDKVDTVTPPAPVANISLAEIDAVRGENAALKLRIAALEESASPAVLDSKVSARLALHESARKVLGSDANLSGQSDRQVMEATIAKASPTFKADGRSDDFLKGMFEATVAGAVSAALAQVNRTVNDAVTVPESKIDKAQKDNAKASRDAWKATK